MLTTIEQFNAAVNSVVWGPFFMALLLGAGLYLSIRLRFLQFTRFPLVWRSTFARLFTRSTGAGAGELSAFQAVSSAMAATVGVGNIAGVSTAMFLGGPGALFWMWVTAGVGMATKFSEVVLGMKYRHINAADGEISGGPMYYIAAGLGQKWLAAVYAFLTGVAALGIGNMVQSNTVATSMQESLALSPSVSGGLVVFCVAVVILGGVRRIGQTAEYLVPVMALVYFAGGMVILVSHLSALPEAIASILAHAFTPAAPVGAWTGATVGAALRYGVARGIFSNEAGLGSASIVHAQAKNTPVGQGLWGMWEVSIDTLVVASVTGLVIMVTGVLGEVDVPPSALAAAAFERGLPGPGHYLVFLSLVLFAYSTMLTWSFYGEKAWEYLFGRWVVVPYRVLFLAFLYIGSVGGLHLVWDVADTLNGLMAIPNLVALLLLAPLVVREKQRELPS
ncbi:MAG: alanine/glycine:cation symporter family protein [Candidatus Binatia bacterium]